MLEDGLFLTPTRWLRSRRRGWIAYEEKWQRRWTPEVVLKDAVEAQDRIIKDAELKIRSERPEAKLSNERARP